MKYAWARSTTPSSGWGLGWRCSTTDRLAGVTWQAATSGTGGRTPSMVHCSSSESRNGLVATRECPTLLLHHARGRASGVLWSGPSINRRKPIRACYRRWNRVSRSWTRTRGGHSRSPLLWFGASTRNHSPYAPSRRSARFSSNGHAGQSAYSSRCRCRTRNYRSTRRRAGCGRACVRYSWNHQQSFPSIASSSRSYCRPLRGFSGS